MREKISHIYIIILLKSVCRCSQSTDRSSCSIVSGDIPNCLYQLSFHSIMRSYISSDWQICYRRKTVQKTESSVDRKIVPCENRCGHCCALYIIDCEQIGGKSKHCVSWCLQPVNRHAMEMIITGPTFMRKRLCSFIDDFS